MPRDHLRPDDCRQTVNGGQDTDNARKPDHNSTRHTGSPGWADARRNRALHGHVPSEEQARTVTRSRRPRATTAPLSTGVIRSVDGVESSPQRANRIEQDTVRTGVGLEVGIIARLV